MVDFGLKRNASGYYDETPYKAVMGMPKEGEVWLTTQDKLFLVLKNHGKFCTTLALNETNRDNECLAVTVEHTMFTNPAMTQYTFNTCFSEYVKRITDEEYLNIMEYVGDRLGVEITVSRIDEDGMQKIKQLEGMCAIRKQNEDELKKELAETKEKLQLCVEKAKEWKSQSENALKPDPEAAIYKKLYNELIERLISRGNVV